MENLRTRIREIITEDPQSWDLAWKENVTPWDVHGHVQPPLKDLLESGEIDFPSQGRALVPGSGRGYDPIFIASSLGFEVIGFDISETAVKAANELLKSTDRSSALDSGSIKFEIGDFFTLTPEDGGYDLIYDYTFFVAIPPSLRPKWGEQMRALVKSGGYLITLIYPLALEQYEGGPPFYVKPQHHVDVLGSGWEKVIDRIPERSVESHIGKERLVVWRRI